MSRKYTKIEPYAEEIFRRKGDGETYREIGRSLGLLWSSFFVTL